MTDHLDISNTNTQIAILTGDPDRAALIATMFARSKLISTKRGFTTYQVWIDQIPTFIIATNMGAPSTAIVVEELIELGITIIIRLGTCGAIQPFIAPGHLIIPNGCVRDEGTSQQYIALAFPAVADPLVFGELLLQTAQTGHPFHTGITHCKDAYYMERPDKQIDPEYVRRQWASWRAAGVLVTEMETAVLFVLGALRKVRTGAVLINVGKDTSEFEYSLKIAVRIIQQTLSKLVVDSLIPSKGFFSPPELSYLSKKSYQKE